MRLSLWLGLLAATVTSLAHAQTVPLFDGRTLAPIIHDDSPTMALAADLLARDLKSLTGQTAAVSGDLAGCGALCVVIGRRGSPLVARVAAETGIDLSDLDGQWERYRRITLRSGDRTYLLIAGSDPRGTIWGVIDLTREMGISAWEWWADVTPRRIDKLAVDGGSILSDSPSVHYRGIFLNDEDWGLEPWAAKTFDPASGNLGHKTYAQIFELMWRLKANLIWPAMHTVSRPFFDDPANPRTARDYAIIIGTSHAEPMMRNNLREWNEPVRGPFNFLTNRAAMADYWRERAEQARSLESIYTIGLRGIHDGPMLGADTDLARKSVLQDVTRLQRDILSKSLGRPAETIPQSLVIYKEVEDAYNAGLSLPEDVTLVWCDDNYGYLGRLGTPLEAGRSGGGGIYYHISYWGRPHDYLWLATTHPGLIREEMGRAYQFNARREWILNVGDIKPGEYLTQYFLDLAFDAKLFDQLPEDHLRLWLSRQFDPAVAPEIADIMMRYYALAFERKPEFMGWGQVEPVTPNRQTDYVQSDGEEAQTRLAAYDQLRSRAEKVAALLPADRRAAFFELVLYPVRASASLNERILVLDLAGLYARQGRASANFYVERARRAEARLVKDTKDYNSLADGKWRGMMDLAPRGLPVFAEPLYPHWSESKEGGCEAAFSGQWADESNSLVFTEGRPANRTITLFGRQAKPIAWRLKEGGGSLSLSFPAGMLDAENGFEQRLTVRYDGGTSGKNLVLDCGGRSIAVNVQVLPKTGPGMPIEENRIIAIPVIPAQDNLAWEIIPQLGSQGSSLRSKLDLPSVVTPDLAAAPPPALYPFSSSSAVGGRLKVTVLPTHPLTPANGLRLGVRLDGGPVRILDFASFGRSDEWRANVLSNSASRLIDISHLAAGDHQLAVTALDPGIILDRIEIDLDGAIAHYGGVAQHQSAKTLH